LGIVNDDSELRQQRMARALYTAVIAIFVWLVVRDAWLCDDAFITFRVVDNFHNDFGLRWNVADRVQVFTHPLWCLVLLCVGFVFDNLPLAALWLSILLSITAFVLIVPRPGRNQLDLVLLALFIPASKAVTQFATSGLEGPLAFVLLTLLILACGGLAPEWSRWDRWVPLLAAAVILTRHDFVLIVAPLFLAWMARKGAQRAAVPIISGAAAIVVWETFSLIYYGSLVPNTALAKLNTELPFLEGALQGLRYVVDFMLRDPAGMLGLVTCLLVLLVRRKDRQARAVATGVGLYLVYIVIIGGDFMSGRFFAVPVFLVVAESIRRDAEGMKSLSDSFPGVCATAVILVVIHFFGFNGFVADNISRNGIADERKVYAPALSLAAIHSGKPIQRVSWVRAAEELGETGPSVMRAIAVGVVGYYGGPNVHILDVNALGDPLLSRLPARLQSRVGHFERQIPPGYEDSLQSGELRIEDEDLRKYCQVVWSVARGPLWSPSRIGESSRLLSGGYDLLLDNYLSRWGEWQREPTTPALPPPDATIEMLFLPEEDSSLPANKAD
jgi:arabinofuranosyltransferase